MIRYFVIASLLAVASTATAQSTDLQVYFNDFDGGLHVEPGVNASLGGYLNTQSVRSYNGIAGPISGSFSGNLLFNGTGTETPPARATTLTLTNLPSHDAVSLGFLFAVIDSWDAGQPDYFDITVDGSRVFRETFEWNAGRVNDQSFPYTEALLLQQNRGWRSDYPDSAYDLGDWAGLQNIAHTENSMTIHFKTNSDFSGYNDEAWGIDNLAVTLHGTQDPASPIPAPLAVIAAIVVIACTKLRRNA